MPQLLYITCTLNEREKSPALSMAEAFLEEYRSHNAGSDVDYIDLYRDNFQRFDAHVIAGWSKINSGHRFDSLAFEEQQKISRLLQHGDRFRTADTYVFVTPRLNLSFVAELTTYIDAICIPGSPFAYTAGGAGGLLKNQRKKALLFHSSRPGQSRKEADYYVEYLRRLMRFLGVEDFTEVVLRDGSDKDEAVKRRAQEAAGDRPTLLPRAASSDAYDRRPVHNLNNGSIRRNPALSQHIP